MGQNGVNFGGSVPPGGTWQGRIVAGPSAVDVDEATTKEDAITIEERDEPPTEEIRMSVEKTGKAERGDPYQDPNLPVTREMKAVRRGINAALPDLTKGSAANEDTEKKMVSAIEQSARDILDFTDREFTAVNKLFLGAKSLLSVEKMPEFFSVMRDISGTVTYLQSFDAFSDFLVSIILPEATEIERDLWKRDNTSNIGNLFERLKKHWDFVLTDNKAQAEAIDDLKQKARIRAVEKYLPVVYPMLDRNSFYQKILPLLKSGKFKNITLADIEELESAFYITIAKKSTLGAKVGALGKAVLNFVSSGRQKETPRQAQVRRLMELLGELAEQDINKLLPTA